MSSWPPTQRPSCSLAHSRVRGKTSTLIADGIVLGADQQEHKHQLMRSSSSTSQSSSSTAKVVGKEHARTQLIAPMPWKCSLRLNVFGVFLTIEAETVIGMVFSPNQELQLSVGASSLPRINILLLEVNSLLSTKGSGRSPVDFPPASGLSKRMTSAESSVSKGRPTTASIA
eukprot:3311673-Amphidinium_carterae.1